MLKKGKDKWADFSRCVKIETPPSNESINPEVPFGGPWDSPRELRSGFHLQAVSALMLAQCKQGANKSKTEQGAFRCYMQHTKTHVTSLETAKNIKAAYMSARIMGMSHAVPN